MSLQLQYPEKYCGQVLTSYAGYSKDQAIRSGAASGGLVSEVCRYLLSSGIVDGVLVTKTTVQGNQLVAEPYIAQTADEILAARTSIYMDFSVAAHYKKLLQFNGKLAVVGLPCQLKLITKLEKQLNKQFIKLSLFCSGSPAPELLDAVLDKKGIKLDEVEKLYFRRGHWRGQTEVVMKNKEIKSFSYIKGVGCLKNIYFYLQPRCFYCNDHFGQQADVCFGDAWLKQFKNKKEKYTLVLVRNQLINDALQSLKTNEKIVLENLPIQDVLKSQKRALIFKYHTKKARFKLGRYLGYKPLKTDVPFDSNWNHYLVSLFILFNIKFSRTKAAKKFIKYVPENLLYGYMLFIRLMLSF